MRKINLIKIKNSKHGLLVMVLAGTGLAVSGCGESFGDRTLSGAGIGAAAGTVGSAIGGGNPVTGGIIGGAAGAAAGAFIPEEDVNLGRPVWDR